MSILLPVVIVVSIGLIAGIGLTVASKFMAVNVDETVAEVNAALPGANCGACGFAGCADYAEAVVNDDTVESNLCPVGGNEVAMKVSQILGEDFSAAEGKHAIVKCSGTYDKTSYVMDFKGLQTCAANKTFYQGRVACTYACMGYGDCVEVCDYDAIHIVSGVAKVDKEKCVGCGLCSKVCPSKLIDIVPDSADTYVGCSNHDKGGQTRKVCSAGCIGCMKCVKECKFEAIFVEDNLAYIDPEKCKNCGMCIKVCPVSVIKSTKKPKKKAATKAV